MIDIAKDAPHVARVVEEIEAHLAAMGDDSKGHPYKAIVSQLKYPEYCGDCDGVGWVEGGTAIQTTCERCDGSGWEPLAL